MAPRSVLLGSGLALLAAGAAAGNAAASHRFQVRLRTDALTGAANRAGLFADLQRRAAADQPYVLALIDLDKFKQVNDTLGHASGDAVLVEVVRRLRRVVDAPGSLVARLGGDEFVVVAASPSAEVSGDVAAGIAFALAEPWAYLGSGLAVTASVGLVHALPGDDPRELLATADYAMYDAKTCGGGQVAEYDGEGLLPVLARPPWRWRDLRVAHREMAMIGRAQ